MKPGIKITSKQSFILFLLFLFASCSSYKGVQGTYYKKGKDYIYNVTLNKDSTFTLAFIAFEVNAKCNGKWHTDSQNKILLKCNPGTFPAIISSGDISDHEYTITVINRNQIRIKNAVLNRIRP